LHFQGNAQLKTYIDSEHFLNMQRRTAVKYLFVVAVGSAILPSCLHKTARASISLKHLDIDSNLEKLVAEIAETIIPSGIAPGAKDTYAHLFVLKMVDDCYTQDEQKKFMDGLKQMNDFSKQKSGASFINCTAAQRKEILNAVENKKAPAEILSFYSIMKKLTIQGYTTSKPILGDVFKFELVPGRYNGFFPVKTIFHQA
jgi:hypothetical protein